MMGFAFTATPITIGLGMSEGVASEKRKVRGKEKRMCVCVREGGGRRGGGGRGEG